MKTTEIFESATGTYAGVSFDSTTNKALHQYIKDNNLPNAPRPDQFHTTVLYSRKHCPNYKPIGQLSSPLVGTTTGLEVWKTQDGKNALVVKYNCPALVDRHKKLMKDHEATYDYPEYKVHVTLSYDIGDIDYKKLPDIKKAIPQITIVKEYGEDLDLDWAKTKGTSKGK